MMKGSTPSAAGTSSLAASLPFFPIFKFFLPFASLPAALHVHKHVVSLQLVPVQVSVPFISPTPGCNIKMRKVKGYFTFYTSNVTSKPHPKGQSLPGARTPTMNSAQTQGTLKLRLQRAKGDTSCPKKSSPECSRKAPQFWKLIGSHWGFSISVQEDDGDCKIRSKSWRKYLYHGEECAGRCSLEQHGVSITERLKNIRAIIPR